MQLITGDQQSFVKSKALHTILPTLLATQNGSFRHASMQDSLPVYSSVSTLTHCLQRDSGSKLDSCALLNTLSVLSSLQNREQKVKKISIIPYIQDPSITRSPVDLCIKTSLKFNKSYTSNALCGHIHYKIKAEFEHLNYTSSLRSKRTTEQCSFTVLKGNRATKDDYKFALLATPIRGVYST